MRFREYFFTPARGEVIMVRVVKKVNNNVAVCIDSQGRELIAFGKGIGFQAVPYELTDLSLIQRTFYDVSAPYMEMIETLPIDVVEFTSELVDQARAVLPYAVSPNLLLTLSDHIAFAMERKRKGIYVKMPLVYDLEQLYPQEIDMARRALDAIQARFGLHLPKEEASGIAMAFINARVYSDQEVEAAAEDSDEEILGEITRIVEGEMGTTIDQTSFNYARYATHVRYLLERLHSGKGFSTVNQGMYQQLRRERVQAAQCVDKVVSHLESKYGFHITEEEQLYLFLHINRVCTNEGL